MNSEVIKQDHRQHAPTPIGAPDRHSTYKGDVGIIRRVTLENTEPTITFHSHPMNKEPLLPP